MFKRANKITALLVAAASVMSLVPAMAADSTRLGTKDGTIEKAIAFNGKYIFEGYKGDEDKAVYFNNGEKDKELTDFEDYDFTTTSYGDKYLLADDGDDYLVDLSNGNITDDTLQDKKDSTASKLEKALGKTDKYDGADVTADDLNGLVKSAAFSEEWYSFTADDGATIFTDANGKYVDSSVTANIYAYSSAKGKIVKVSKFDKDYSDIGLRVELVKQPQVIAQDKDNLYAIVNVDIIDSSSKNGANLTADRAAAVAAKADAEERIAVYTNGTDTVAVAEKATLDAAKLAVTNQNTVIDGAQTAYDTAVASEAAAKTVAQASGATDAEKAAYVDAQAVTATALATLNTEKANLTPLTAAVTTAQAAYDAKVKDTTYGKQLIQAQADLAAAVAKIAKIDAAITAGDTTKTTNAWYLQKISKAQGSTDEEAYLPKDVASYQIDNKSLYDNGDVNDAYGWLIKDGAVANIQHVQVKDNSLFVYKKDDADTVKVFKLDLKQIKENPVDKEVFGSTKLDGYVVKKDGDSDQDFEDLSVDVNGVLWVLNSGKIIKYDGKDKTTVYTCDSGFDSLSVYDAKNLIAWSYDDERYTTVTEGTKVTQDEATVVAPVIVTGWVQAADGSWSFNDATGTKVASKWINVGGYWYYLKADGVMATGWYNDNGTWYFLKSSGAMATGWLNDNGTWYYLNASGAMLANTTVDGYKLGASGAWVK